MAEETFLNSIKLYQYTIFSTPSNILCICMYFPNKISNRKYVYNACQNKWMKDWRKPNKLNESNKVLEGVF